MVDLTLKAEKREELKGSNPRKILAAGYLPAIIYGPGAKNLNIKLNHQNFLKVFNIAGESQVIGIELDGKIIQVLTHRVQKDPITDKIIHVDFYQFKKDHKFQVDIPIKFIGESVAVKEGGGILVTALDSIVVECLYADLISEIEVDLSILKEINDSIHVSDINLGENIRIVTSSEQAIVTVKAVKVEEEVEAAEEAEGEEGVEAVEGEEGEEGEKSTEKEGEAEKPQDSQGKTESKKENE